MLDEILEGLFESNDIKKPTTVTQCFNEETANQLITYLDNLLAASHTDGIRDFIEFIRILIDMRHTLPEEVYECVVNNPEFLDLERKYGINEHTNMRLYHARIIKYITLHITDTR